MKQLFTGIFFFLSAVGAIAQGTFKIEQENSIHFPSMPSVIIFGNTAYNRLEASMFSNHHQSLGGHANRSVGLILEAPLTSKWSMRLGAVYAPRDFIGYLASPCERCYPNENVTMIFKHRYIDVPLSARYYIASNRFLFFAEAGVVVSVLSMNRNKYKKTEHSPGEWSMQHIDGVVVNDHMIGAIAGVGIGISVSPKIDILVSPTYNYILTEYTPMDDYRPHAIVVSFGLGIKIGRAK